MAVDREAVAKIIAHANKGTKQGRLSPP